MTSRSLSLQTRVRRLETATASHVAWDIAGALRRARERLHHMTPAERVADYKRLLARDQAALTEPDEQADTFAARLQAARRRMAVYRMADSSSADTSTDAGCSSTRIASPPPIPTLDERNAP